MSIDECFEFDYLMEADQESRENAEREDRERDREIARDYRSSWTFYWSRKSTNTNNSTTTSNNKQIKKSKPDWWKLIILSIIAIFVICYLIDEAHQEKRKEEWRAKSEEIKAQELLEAEANSWYEEIPTLDQAIILDSEEIVEPKQAVYPGESPYDWCSYIWDDNLWHQCLQQPVK